MVPASLIIAVGVFGLVLCGGWLLMQVLDRYTVQINARLNELPKGLATQQSGGAVLPVAEATASRPKSKWPDVVNHLVPDGSDDRKRQQSRLMQAGIYSPMALSTFF